MILQDFVTHVLLQGIKICARDNMDKTLAGMPVYVAKYPEEAEVGRNNKVIIIHS